MRGSVVDLQRLLRESGLAITRRDYEMISHQHLHAGKNYGHILKPEFVKNVVDDMGHHWCSGTKGRFYQLVQWYRALTVSSVPLQFAKP